jgi:hypothetical protein
VSLFTLFASIAPLNGTDKRGWRLKPSRELRTAMSSQSERRVSQSGSGRLTRRPVLWLVSATVNQSLGKGPVTGALRSKRA